jgi:hypothetical protein
MRAAASRQVSDRLIQTTVPAHIPASADFPEEMQVIQRAIVPVWPAGTPVYPSQYEAFLQFSRVLSHWLGQLSGLVLPVLFFVLCFARTPQLAKNG